MNAPRRGKQRLSNVIPPVNMQALTSKQAKYFFDQSTVVLMNIVHLKMLVPKKTLNGNKIDEMLNDFQTLINRIPISIYILEG